MAKSKERSEDLNPRSEDVDEKIRKLLDLSVPDDNKTETNTKTKISEVSGKKPIENSEVKAEEATAPELMPKKSGGKVIVPTIENEDIAQETAEHEDTPPKEPEEEKPVVKIEIDHADESNEEVAKELDDAIADLDNTKGGEELKPTEEVAVQPETPSEASDDADELPEPEEVTSEETEEAVKDIVAKEGDELLEKEVPAPKKEEAKPKKPKIHFSLKKFITSKRTLSIFLALVIAGLIAAIIYPTSRYKILNLAGVRSRSSLTVIDISSQQPLKNVSVTLAGATVNTDSNGLASFENLRLGKTKLKIDRTAFAPIEQDLTIGWGSNPLGDYLIEPTGAQYKIILTDFLSGKTISSAEADSEHASARADESGLIILTLPPLEQTTVEVKIMADQYREETITLDLSKQEATELKLVAGKRHLFISKRSGKYDVYSIYADAQQEKLILPASGNERKDMSLVPHPTKEVAAFVSTRAGKQNSDGFLLSDLVILDVETGKTEPVATAEKIQVVGWWQDRLVYVATTSGESAATADRSKLISFNTGDGTSLEIAKANYFNDLVMIADSIYYAPAGTYTKEAGRFYRAKIDNASKAIPLFDGEVWSVVRLTYDELALSVGRNWYGFKLGDTAATERSSAPVNIVDRLYVANYASNKAAWVDQRDGKGVLLVYDLDKKSEAEVASGSGIARPVVWLNKDTLIYRIETSDEVADYVVNVTGGKPLKVIDVTSTQSSENWYFY